MVCKMFKCSLGGCLAAVICIMQKWALKVASSGKNSNETQ